MMIRPFLKWPGGKFRLIPVLKSHLPARTCLVEPFVGAGALFLNTDYPETVLNDINPDLINLYQQIQKKGKKFIPEAKKFFTTKHNVEKKYYHIREHFNESDDLWLRALYFLYLNRHGYNGLCRYNLKGYYNVPFGDYKRPYFPEAELEFFQRRAKKVRFYCQDYVSLLKNYAKQSNLSHLVLYCDPPYTPLTKTANFTGYAAHRFTLEHQTQLAELAKTLAQKGAIVIISNHDTPFTRQIYQGAAIQPLKVARSISCSGANRRKVGEVIACFG
ncbi:MAG: Dam family site-specific DNA-(adenine-N6)-methyltransferase [Candidatus Berkiellales bacterium]